MHIIIDGYNLIHAGRTAKPIHRLDLERERNNLIELLSVYKKIRMCEITIVFDGWQEGWPLETREKRKGLEVIFSSQGEKADEVIKRLVKTRGSGVVVVTSDREIMAYAEKLKAVAISSERFREKIDDALFSEGGVGEDYEREKRRKLKGPSKSLSKREKRKRSVLRKL